MVVVVVLPTTVELQPESRHLLRGSGKVRIGQIEEQTQKKVWLASDWTHPPLVTPKHHLWCAQWQPRVQFPERRPASWLEEVKVVVGRQWFA